MTGPLADREPARRRSYRRRAGVAAACGLALIGTAVTGFGFGGLDPGRTGPATAWAAEADAERGRAVYDRCIGCHALDRNRTGPKHCGLLGRRAGGVDGFRYSRAMRESGIVWSRQTLDAFIADPMAVVRGTRMGYAGVKDAGDRADLIAYIVAAQTDPAVCP